MLLQDHESIGLDADLGAAKTEGRGRDKAEPPIEVRVSEQYDCRLPAAMCFAQTAADELGPDASSLVIRTDPRRTENHQRAVPDPRSAELHVANDPSITFGNEGERTFFVADGSDRFDYVVYRVAVPRLMEGEISTSSALSRPPGSSGRIGHRRFSLSIPTSTARRVPSSSQSISNSAECTATAEAAA